MTSDTPGVSFWLEEVSGSATPHPALSSDHTVDIAIIGAGFTGLWTAYELLRREPRLRIAILERQTAGFGASGRNGAWLSAGLSLSPDELARRNSAAVARTTIETMRATVDEVIATTKREGIDAKIRQGGVLRVARGPHEIPALQRGMQSYERVGAGDGLELLSPAQVAERIRIADCHGALFDPNGAAIQPAMLVTGLVDAVTQRGANLFERTNVTAIHPRSSGVEVATEGGRVRAEVAVIATEAWSSDLAEHRRRVIPLYSLIVLTEPIERDRWDQIGWRDHELLASHRYTVDYLSRTADGRVLFGGRGAPYHFKSRIDPSFDRHARTHQLLRDQLRSWFPVLADVAFTHAWGGPLGMPRDWSPNIWFDRTRGIAAAYGYTGQGVATSNLAGRVLADLIVHGHSVHEQLPFVGHRSRRWEPEPLRWLATRFMQRALQRIDARASATGTPPSGSSVAERLLRH